MKDLYDILNNFKSRNEAYKYFGILDNSPGIIKLKNLASSVGFDLKVYDERKKPLKKFCQTCGNIIGKNCKKFCSSSCAAKFNNSHRIVTEKTKNKIRKSLTKPKKK